MKLERLPKIYLSRRNLMALLSKLDRVVAGKHSECSIIKNKGVFAEYQQTMKDIMVIAVDDEEYYESQNRSAGEMHPADEVNLPKPKPGTVYGGSIL